VKQEFRDGGFDYFPTHKVLELMLFYCIPQKDTNLLAHRLVDRFGSFADVLAAQYESLLEVEGVGTEVATYLKLLEASYKRYVVESYSNHGFIHSVDDAKQYVQHRFLAETTECFLLMCLNLGGKIVYVNKIAQHDFLKDETFPLSIVKTCLKANAMKVVIAHNHLNASSTPTLSDIKITKALDKALMLVDVELFDHLILAANEIYSTRECGIMPNASWHY
jgi:DNA repair protein RadC